MSHAFSSPIRTARRAEKIRYAVRDVVLVAREAQAAGKELLYLNIGDPNVFDFVTPPHIVEAIAKALRDNQTSYSASEGMPSALEAIRQDAEERCGIRGVRDAFVGNGASECIEIALSALADEGDEVLTPSPGYPLYTAVLGKLGCPEVPYDLDEDNGWQPDVDDIAKKITDRTRALVLINPNNPTGSICERGTLEKVLELAAKHGIVVFADEIYDRLPLDDDAPISIASLTDELPILTFNGLSKAYLGPGLRLGWCTTSGPETIVRPYIDAMHKFLRARLCASHPVQHAVAPALQGDPSHIAEACERLRRRRDITVARLNAIEGVSCVAPKAAFYAFPRLEDGAIDDEAWVKALIRETGVVTVHGSGFGQRPGTSHFRVVFLPPEETLERAFTAIDGFMKSRG
ncbi:MAG: aminotransferase [Proteobacteria bacterium]|nr:MAG: aminotransferase [Pseudomonadota bacterium]